MQCTHSYALQHTAHEPSCDIYVSRTATQCNACTAAHFNTLPTNLCVRDVCVSCPTTQCNACTATHSNILFTNLFANTQNGSKETSLINLSYGVATISRMLKNIGLFCKRALQKRPVFCKETCIFKHPTHRSHPILYKRVTSCYTHMLHINE